LGHAMNCELTYENFAPVQTNFHLFEAMRFHQAPEIIVKGLELGGEVRGIGEPPVPPAAPALANAIFALTGKRVRELPLNRSVNFA
jgi:isoquinoline 1-oxidoreductase beta subunit